MICWTLSILFLVFFFFFRFLSIEADTSGLEPLDILNGDIGLDMKYNYDDEVDLNEEIRTLNKNTQKNRLYYVVPSEK